MSVVPLRRSAFSHLARTSGELKCIVSLCFKEIKAGITPMLRAFSLLRSNRTRLHFLFALRFFTFDHNE